MANIQLQILLPLRSKFLSEEELNNLIAAKTRELEDIPSENLPMREAITSELVKMEKKLKREIDAKVPREIQNTREALAQLLRAETHTPPIANVSLQFLRLCTKNFSEETRIGKGGFGSVYHAHDAAMGAQYAVKTTDKYNDPSLRREVEILSRVFHPNIIRLFGFYQPPNAVAPQFLVYEYAAGGTLSDILKSPERRRAFDWSLRLSAAVGVASALHFLHNGMETSIAHHDIKPENIVFTDTLDRAILIDCGISKVLKMDAVNFTRTKAGTPFYLPDDYNEDTPYDQKCEVFSFGMVLRVMISGRMPRNFGERELLLRAVIAADPVAGKYPSNILPAFVKLTEECVSINPADRPSVEQLYLRLLELNRLAEEEAELTPIQQETIDQTLYESRQVSRAMLMLEAKGKCFCSPRRDKKGLFCPGKAHFQCSECFNKYVLDYLGEDIYCRESGCKCKTPYTLDELHVHVGRRILCRHIETLIKNRELAVRRSNADMMNEMGRGFDRVMRGVTNVARDELKCPMLVLLIPAFSSGQRSTMRRGFRNWKDATTKTFYLYFLCAHDRALIDAPIILEARRDWVKKAVPFLRAAIIGLSIAVVATGVPIKLPMFEFDNEGGLTGLSNKIAQNLVALDQMLVDASGVDDGMDNQVKELHQAMQANDSGRMSSESYLTVAEMANKPENLEWKSKMTLAERDGELAWVKRENEERWKRAPRS